MIDTQRERIFFAQIIPVLIDDGQPIGVRILAETNVGFGCRHTAQNAGKIFGGRFGRVFELTIGLVADQRNLAAQFFEQPASHQATGSMVRIEQHAKSHGANSLDIDRLSHQRPMRAQRVTALLPPAQLLIRDPSGLARAVPVDNLLTFGRRNDAAFGGE